MTNHLANENSPYLLQHANNPVDWYPWDKNALDRSRTEDKPIFLSIGYAACHWCHVMAHESFEDPAIAALMNEHFINIKVDREERPDLDSIYMSATVAMTGSGGWPMSVFLTPDLRPFYAGTYFPPTPRFNLPSFRDLIMAISRAWKEQREEIFRVGSQVTEHIENTNDFAGAVRLKPSNANLSIALENILKSYDWGFGGWGDAPKFPQPMTIEFMLSMVSLDQNHNFAGNQGVNERTLKTVIHCLKAMARGGMYDVVGGGFSRYSVDNHWKTPHFEKMLYDNAQLAQAYLHAYLVTGELFFRQVCEETLDFVLRELTHPDGGFYSSIDADSEGEEGKYYLWSREELRTILGKEYNFFEAAYGLSKIGLDGSPPDGIILQREVDDQNLASHNKISLEEVREKLSICHNLLNKARSKRIRPATDNKILTAWNGLMLSAFAEAGRYLKRQDYILAAEKNANFLLQNLLGKDGLSRSWRNGSARHPASLEDFAALILGLLALYQTSPDQKWYAKSLVLADWMVEHFADRDGTFFDTSDAQEALLTRPKNFQDNAIPSGNALATLVQIQLAEFGDRPNWREPAENRLASVLEPAIRYPTSFAKWLYAESLAIAPMKQVALIGSVNQPETQALLTILWNAYRPHIVFAQSEKPISEGSTVILNDKPLMNGHPTVYVCEGFVCRQPVTSPEDLALQLSNSPNH